MLVLKRKLYEGVVLQWNDEKVVVTLVELGEQSVKLGFEAPLCIDIHRDDAVDKFRREPS